MFDFCKTHFENTSILDLVQLCKTQMFKFVLYGNKVCVILEQSSFQKYTRCWVFLALCHMLYLCVCVFCICIFVFACLTHGNIIFDILEQSSFQKYITCWVFLALCHMLYLCICVFIFLYLCVCHMEIPFFISLNNPLFKNIPHVGSFWHFVICCICVFVYLYLCICV